MDMVHCRACGKEIHETEKECPHCGASQNLVKKDGKNKVVAALLAFFLGALGIHRFYLGQWWGVFYLLFCWTMIPSLVSFIETIVFLLSNQESWDEKYNDGISSGHSSGVLIAVVIIIIGFVGIAVLGILAAVAIPSYQDYTARAQVAEGIAILSSHKTTLNDYYAKNKDFMGVNSSELNTVLSSDYVESVSLGHAAKETVVLIATFKSVGVNSNLQNKEVRIYTIDGGQTWSCGMNIEDNILMGDNQVQSKYMPSSCK